MIIYYLMDWDWTHLSTNLSNIGGHFFHIFTDVKIIKLLGLYFPVAFSPPSQSVLANTQPILVTMYFKMFEN